MTTKLTDLEIEEGSLVDKGANQEARVVLFKRDAETPAVVPRTGLSRLLQIIGKALGLVDSELDVAVDEALGGLQAADSEPAGEEVQDMVDQETAPQAETEPQAEVPAEAPPEAPAETPPEAEAPAEVVTATAEAPDATPDTVTKRLADLEAEREDLRKRAEAAEAEIAKAQAEIAKAQADAAASEEVAKAAHERAEMVELTKRCEAWGNVAKADDLAVLLKTAPTPDYAAKLEALFDTCHKRIEQGDLFKEKGSDQPADDSAHGKLRKLAKEAVAKGEYATEAIAVDALLQQSKDLQAEYLRETQR